MLAVETRINLPIEKDAIRSLIPHAGGMCLLDRVLDWDEDTIVCVSLSHHAPDNPLRRNGRLAALHAFEYGAQAAAVHGALWIGAPFGPRGAEPAYLAALHDARLYANYLDDIATPLEVAVRRLLHDRGDAVYQTSVRAGDRLLAEARLNVMAAR